jgi:hypothetical protein
MSLVQATAHSAVDVNYAASGVICNSNMFIVQATVNVYVVN